MMKCLEEIISFLLKFELATGICIMLANLHYNGLIIQLGFSLSINNSLHLNCLLVVLASVQILVSAFSKHIF